MFTFVISQYCHIFIVLVQNGRWRGFKCLKWPVVKEYFIFLIAEYFVSNLKIISLVHYCQILYLNHKLLLNNTGYAFNMNLFIIIFIYIYILYFIYNYNYF